MKVRKRVDREDSRSQGTRANQKATRSKRTKKKKAKTDLLTETVRSMFPDPNEVVVIRALEAVSGNRTCTASGCFTDRRQLIAAIKQLDAKGARGIYLNLNKVDPAIVGRALNRIEYWTKNTTRDDDIVRRKFLLVDLDPENPAGTSASDAETDRAKQKMAEVQEGLRDELGQPAIVAFSGNGYHLLYRIDLPNNDLSKDLIKSALEVISRRYSDQYVKIDTAVHDAARIVRCYGTLARKGDPVPQQNRHHRRSKIVATFDELVSEKRLSDFVSRNMQESAGGNTKLRSRPSLGEFREHLESLGLALKQTKEIGQGQIALILRTCPMNPDHGTRGESAVIWGPDGIGFKCFHDSCSEYRLKDVLKELDPNWRMALARFSSIPTRDQLPRYVDFPVHCLPQRIAKYVAKSANAIGCDPAYIGVPMLSVLGAAIGNSRVAQLKESWREPPIVWAVVVGESGTQKSPALDKAIQFTQDAEQQAREDYELANDVYKKKMKEYEEAQKNKDHSVDDLQEPEQPTLNRYHVNDITIEALAERLEKQPRGLLLVSEEISAWLRGIHRYGGGYDAGQWLPMHGGRPLIVDRKSGDKVHIYVPRASLSVTGTTQPGVLKKLFDEEAFDSGLAARLLVVMPPKRRRRWTDADTNSFINDPAGRAIRRLYAIDFSSSKPRGIPLSREAKKLWVKFYNEHADEQHNLQGSLAAAWSKLEGYVARFSLIIRFGEWAGDQENAREPSEIDELSMAKAIEMGRWFCRETERVYSMFGPIDGSPTLNREVLDFIRKKGIATTREISRNIKSIKSSEEAERALRSLLDLGLVVAHHTEPGPKGGRPTTKYVVADETPENTSDEQVSTKSSFAKGLKRPTKKKAKASTQRQPKPRIMKKKSKKIQRRNAT